MNDIFAKLRTVMNFCDEMAGRSDLGQIVLDAITELGMAEKRLKEAGCEISRLQACLHEADEWHPIAEALGNPDVRDGLKPVLIGCFVKGELLWAMMATWGTAHWGFINCASQTGWRLPVMPQMAEDGEAKYKNPKARWISASGEFAPTHYRPL